MPLWERRERVRTTRGWLMMLVEKSFDTGEVVLNYAEGPDNGPPILFIHGITSNWLNFLP